MSGCSSIGSELIFMRIPAACVTGDTDILESSEMRQYKDEGRFADGDRRGPDLIFYCRV